MLAKKLSNQICFTLVFASFVCFCFQLVSHGIYLQRGLVDERSEIY